jgi:hypothetical protein
MTTAWTDLTAGAYGIIEETDKNQCIFLHRFISWTPFGHKQMNEFVSCLVAAACVVANKCGPAPAIEEEDRK